MQPWQITLECMGMLVLWIVNACADIFTIHFLYLHHHYHETLVMSVLIGVIHVIVNGWTLRFYRRNLKWTELVALFLTQTMTLFLVSRRAWQSLSSYFTKDDRTRKRKLLIAKYLLFIETKKEAEDFPHLGNEIELRSCLPPEVVENSNHIPTIPDPSNDIEDRDPLMNAFFTSEEESQHISHMGNTRYIEGTCDIEQNFWSPQEVYTGEPNLKTFLLKTLQHLFINEKKMSYHVVTDSNHKILHITKSNQHVKRFPNRNLPEQPSVFCNDIHYAVNLSKTSVIEVITVTKRTFSDLKILVDADFSKFIWMHVWPSAVIKLYLILHLLDTKRDNTPLVYMSPLISIITWLMSQKRITEPWRNIVLMIPLQLNLTVTRALLVMGIGINSLKLAGACYISVKAVGVMAFIAYVAYVKKVKNLELYSDAIDRYNYNPLLDPVIQFSESCAYISWAIWLYSSIPQTPSAMLVPEYNHLSLIILIVTFLGHVFGLVWLWSSKSKVKEPLRDPKNVLKLIQLQEYSRTENNMSSA
ncbi:uncharacterized protein [Palaemon carinicauda]|uniref:uncharacterized protein n=1 Tax=Palaemon carinicauda TaxID=392227 RepID=UPI0035B6A454